MARFDAVAFDGDDTLWENEGLFVAAQEGFRLILSRYLATDSIDGQLLDTERRNLPLFGYGIKGFALSMIETAVEMTDGRVTGSDIRAIMDLARQMMAVEVRLLPHARETVEALAGTHRLMLVTKGDLHDQERKVALSGLARSFEAVEILSEKSTETYDALLRRHGIVPARFLMVGNSLRSDVLPVLALGGTAVHVPHLFTWSHERADAPPTGQPGYHALEHLGLLSDLLRGLEAAPVADGEA